MASMAISRLRRSPNPRDYPTVSYDATMATGVFSVRYGPPSGWDEEALIVRKGGYFVLTLRPDIYESEGFKVKEEDSVAACKWELVETTALEQLPAKGDPDLCHQIRIPLVVLHCPVPEIHL